jgi:NAD dependent epimerase/dehydratase family enzyme
MKRTALVLGANGLIGNLVVDILLKNTNYDTVYAVSRKGIQNESNKLIQILASADNISEKINNIQVDDFFFLYRIH